MPATFPNTPELLLFDLPRSLHAPLQLHKAGEAREARTYLFNEYAAVNTLPDESSNVDNSALQELLSRL